MTQPAFVLLGSTSDFWEAFYRFCNDYGNVASVVGLVITLIGFVLIWFGQRKLRQTVRQSLDKVAVQLYLSEVGNLLQLINGVREACRSREVARAIDKCQDARVIAIRLAGNPTVTKDEAIALRGGDNDLRLLLTHLERLQERSEEAVSLPIASSPDQEETVGDASQSVEAPLPSLPVPLESVLSDHRRRALDRLVGILATIQGRLQHSALEGPYARN